METIPMEYFWVPLGVLAVVGFLLGTKWVSRWHSARVAALRSIVDRNWTLDTLVALASWKQRLAQAKCKVLKDKAWANQPVKQAEVLLAKKMKVATDTPDSWSVSKVMASIWTLCLMVTNTQAYRLRRFISNEFRALKPESIEDPFGDIMKMIISPTALKEIIRKWASRDNKCLPKGDVEVLSAMALVCSWAFFERNKDQKDVSVSNKLTPEETEFLLRCHSSCQKIFGGTTVESNKNMFKHRLWDIMVECNMAPHTESQVLAILMHLKKYMEYKKVRKEIRLDELFQTLQTDPYHVVLAALVYAFMHRWCRPEYSHQAAWKGEYMVKIDHSGATKTKPALFIMLLAFLSLAWWLWHHVVASNPELVSMVCDNSPFQPKCFCEESPQKLEYVPVETLTDYSSGSGDTAGVADTVLQISLALLSGGVIYHRPTGN